MDNSRNDGKGDDRRSQKPGWFKIRLRTDGEYKRVNELVSQLSLHTVCQHARCPNIYECWVQGTATFLIMGDVCTRRCGFCSVTAGKPAALDPEEPARIADAVASLELEYAVITSVDRDDLDDGGSAHFAGTIRSVASRSPECKVEVLIPDFNGNKNHLDTVLEARPDCLAHNIETVSDLYRRVRPAADYAKSLDILEHSVKWRRRRGADMTVKCGIMVGLGETMDQILDTLREIAETGCEIMTVGQYLRPTKRALQVERYYTPEEFVLIREEGLRLGFKHVESGPLVRSSYHAKTQAETAGLGSE
jgi:lipoic acid synthetase